MRKYRIITFFAVMLMLGTAIMWGGQYLISVNNQVTAGTSTDVKPTSSSSEFDNFGELPNRGHEVETDYPELQPTATAPAAEPSATPAPTLTPVPTATLAPTPSPVPTTTPVPTATPYPVETDAAGIIQEGMPVDVFFADDSTFYVKAFAANIRELPRTDADIVIKVVMGDRLRRTGYGLNWSSVKTGDGKTGYILTDLISADVIYKPAPTATPTPNATPTPKPTAKPTPKPTAKPEPTAAPEATEEPAAEPTSEPVAEPTPVPAEQPTENKEYDLFCNILALEGSSTYGYESYLAVATVIMNQVASPKYPNTVTGVVSYPGRFSTYTKARDGAVSASRLNANVYRAASDAYYNGKRNMPSYVIAFITPTAYERNVANGGSFSKMEVYQVAYGAVWCYYAADAR